MMASNSTKIVIYQVLPRLFGNTKTEFIPWGTKEDNGIGKLSAFTDKALEALKDLGVTHLWLTGILHHALIADYNKYGISNDDPDVVKGRAGSPYAIKDYYSVSPDLADDPARRNEEYRELIERIHKHGLKVIMDIVPNHVARNYESTLKPLKTEDFGSGDQTSLEYEIDNNFYYIPGQAFEVPDFEVGFEPLGGELHPLSDGKFDEFPAKWTGNGSRKAKPGINDWYETVKLNYGIRPDGSWDFDSVPNELLSKPLSEQLDFWKGRKIPDTWIKMKDIALFWMDFAIDGFRYDMAEMVPIPFWHFLNTHIKDKAANTLCIAEIYNPALYHDFINTGKMDYLYDKVDLYDCLRDIMVGNKDCNTIFHAFDKHYAISEKLLHFMENHDEQRIASNEFAGNPFKAMPAMVLSACIGKGALMIYNGQEVGEPALDKAGFGSPSRTSIFDYIGIPKHQKWMNYGKFDGALLSDDDIKLREQYRKLIQFTKSNRSLLGRYYDLHRNNADSNREYPSGDVYAFARWHENDKTLIICNFSARYKHAFRFNVYYDLIETWELAPGSYEFVDHFTEQKFELIVKSNHAYLNVEVEALASLILTKERKKVL